MSKMLIIDAARCNGCYNCQIACKDEFCGNDWEPYSRPQPETGQFWMRVNEQVQGTLPKVRVHYLPVLCAHCEKPACAEVCEAGAFHRREDGILILDPEKCSGCRKCISACPYGAVFYNAELKIAQKCTGCAHLLDHGSTLPRCVEACPVEAITVVDREAAGDLLLGTEDLHPEANAAPAVRYRNLPRTFIGGTVYDPVQKEVIPDTLCVLTCGGRTRRCVTDSFGDFWFEDLPAGIYSLNLQAKGYRPKLLENLRNETSLNLGDIPLENE